jgi:glycosyltransferase involved in cell wall biosynthesis
MEKSPLVSVIIPVYKAEQYLRRCLDSICNQTYTNLEIITVNDGSPDNSLNILKEYEQKDRRIIVIDKENGGANTARESALTKVTGEWITFVDSDDWIDNNYIKELMYYSNECQLICGGFQLDKEGNIYKTNKTQTGLDRVSSLELLFNIYFGMIYNIWGKIFKKDIIKGNNLGFRSYKRDDGILILDYFQHIDKINIVSTDALLHYNTQNITSLTHQKLNGIIKTMIELYKYHNSFQKLIETDYNNYDRYIDILNKEKSMSFCEILHETYPLPYKEKLYWYQRMIDQLPNFTLCKYLHKPIHKWLRLAFKMRSPRLIYFILEWHLLKNRIRAKLRI